MKFYKRACKILLAILDFVEHISYKPDLQVMCKSYETVSKMDRCQMLWQRLALYALDVLYSFRMESFWKVTLEVLADRSLVQIEVVLLP